MSEHAVVILLGIASVAIAISGFSGVVAVFADRAEGIWTPDVRFRTTNMLILSLGACLLSFVPLTLELLQVPDQPLWMIASTTLLIFCAFFFVYTFIRLRNPILRQPRVLVPWVRFVYFGSLALAIALQVLNMAGVLVDCGPGFFVAGLMLLLIPAGLQFAFLVLTPLKSTEI